jgi:hypothetical protein
VTFRASLSIVTCASVWCSGYDQRGQSVAGSCRVKSWSGSLGRGGFVDGSGGGATPERGIGAMSAPPLRRSERRPLVSFPRMSLRPHQPHREDRH